LAASVAGFDGVDAVEVFEDGFEAPEATAGKGGLFVIRGRSGHKVLRNDKNFVSANRWIALSSHCPRWTAHCPLWMVQLAVFAVLA
jgi:hypothetical protein